MAAGLGFKTFNTGDVLSAADTNGYLMQGVLVFANAAARDAAITSPQEGQCCYLKDTDAVQTYSGAAWVGFDDSNAIQNSIVDAKGDIVAASGNDTPARLAVGNSGDTLVADSATATGLRYKEDYAAGKNKIINGDFGIWQRGTSFTGYTTKTYTADRWTSEFNGTGATRTVSRQTFTPATAPVAGYEGQFYLSYNRSVAGTSPADYLTYRVEDVRTFAGQTATISFWAKANSSMSLSDITFYQEFGSGGSVTVTTTTSAKTITTSWARYTTTVSVPSISGKTIGTSSALAIYFVLPNSGTFTFDIWGVQVEESSVATAFQTATGTLQGELAACQRYYYQSDKEILYWANVTNANNYYLTAYFPVAMRISPTMTSTDVSNTNFTAGNPSLTVIGKFSFWAFKGASGTGVGNFQFNYTATAEL